VIDRTCKVDFDLVAFGDPRVKFRTLDDGQTGVDGVAIKGPGKGTRDHSLDAQSHNGRGGLLACASATKVSSCDEDCKVAELVRKTFTENFESVLRELLRFDVNQIAAGNDDVGVDVVSELVNLAADEFIHFSIWKGANCPPESGETVLAIKQIIGAPKGVVADHGIEHGQ